MKTETTEEKYKIFLSHYVNNIESYKTLYNEALDEADIVTKEMLDAMYGDYDFYKYEDYVNLLNKSSIENLYLYSEQEVLEEILIPVNIKKIVLNFPNLIQIDDDFLSGCSGLVDIDLSGLSVLRSIGDDFLSRCTGLVSIDLSELSGLRSIGDNFLYNCSGLTGIDLSGMSGLRSIGDNFLNECWVLNDVNLSGLSDVRSIGNDFLFGCSELIEIDLSSMTSVTSIGKGFLSGCNELDVIDLSSMTRLTSIGKQFLSGCGGLIDVIVIRDSSISNIIDRMEFDESFNVIENIP